MKKIIVTFLFFIIASTSQAQKYRNILPPRPPFPPALNNTVQSQIANQNINFNTSSNINGIGGGGIGGFNANSGGIQGTTQYTQNNTPGSQLSFLYQLPSATQFQQGGGGFGQGGGNMGGGGFGQGGGGFGQGGGGFGQGGGGFGQGGGGVQAIGMNNPFYSMAMQGIMAGVGVSAFQSGGGFGQFGGGNMGGGGFGQFGGGNIGGQFGGCNIGGLFGGFGGGFNNGGNGL